MKMLRNALFRFSLGYYMPPCNATLLLRWREILPWPRELESNKPLIFYRATNY
jgi:hypothetical protein